MKPQKTKSHRPSVFELTQVVPTLAQCKTAFAEGRKRSLLDAIGICARDGLLMPAWVQVAFMDAYNQVVFYDVGSWDEAFGKPFNMNAKHVAAKRKQFAKSIAVYEAIHEALKQGGSTGNTKNDKSVFAKVGKHFNISASTARDYYYDLLNGKLFLD